MIRQCGSLPTWLSGKESACDAGDLDSIPASGRPRPLGEGIGNPLQYSHLGNPTDRGGVAKQAYTTW